MWAYFHVISIFLFLILSWLFYHKITKGFLPTAKRAYGWLRAGWKNRLLASFVLLFLVFFLVVNIFSFDFVAYNEDETKYTYSFYMTHMLWPSLQEYGTNQGGLFPIFAILYHLLGISTFQDSILLSKALLTLAFFVSFYLVWHIVRFFVREKKGECAITTLLTIFYFSMPQIASFFWEQALYHLYAHLLFLISLYSILDYSKSRSTLSFFISFLSVTMAFLTRPEFGAFAILIFSINLAQHLDFSRLRLKEMGKKEKTLLLLSFLYLAAMLLFSVNFINSYGQLYPSGDILLVLMSNIQSHLAGLTVPFAVPICILILLVCLLSLIFYRGKREILLLCLLFYILLNLYIMRTIRYEAVMYIFYLQIILFMMLAHASSWLLAGTRRFGWLAILLGISLLALILSSSYFVISSNRLPLINDGLGEYGSYNRHSCLKMSRNAYDFYLVQKDKNAVLFEKYSGNLYYKFLLAGTNNTVIGFEGLKEIDSTYASADKFIFIESPANRCTFDEIEAFLIYFYEEMGLPFGITIEDYPAIMSNLKNSTLRPYARFGDIFLCRIN